MAERPDPDVLLARVNAAESRARRGRLTVFFGAAPGVGKTYAMLEAGRLEKESGRDVVIGVVETHGRYDTGALTLGHEILPRREVDHKGIKLTELDLDAALSRKPSLLLVDELAHENAPGSRHAKRFQDVDELLAAGIDVFTTLNVQHLESLNDVVAKITQVVVRETVPDSVFEAADDVRLLDLPIDELLERLRDGKVYAPGDAARAAKSFFQPGNLIALRELALRVTARRVDVDMRRYRTEHGIERTWPVAERWLVAVSASPASEALIRTARRLATEAHAEWIAAYVETPASLRLSARGRERASEHLRLATILGGETATLAGTSGPEEIVRFARSQNVTRILVGRPTHAAWRDRLRTPFLDALVREAADIDVHVITAEAREGRRPVAGGEASAPETRAGAFVGGAGTIGAATLFSLVVFGRTAIADIAMVYVLGIVLVSLRWGFGPSMLAAVLAVLSFDYFFIPPYYTFAVADLSHVATFGVMFLVAGVISELTRRVRDQAAAARERELRTASLFALTRALTTAKSARDVAVAASEHLARVFDAKVVLLAEKDGALDARSLADSGFELDEKERAAAEWVFKNGRPAGATTDTLPNARALYLPLDASPLLASGRAASAALGIVGLAPNDQGRLARLDSRQHLEAFLGPIAGALERTRLAEKAQEALVRVESEELKNALLSSVSHDLRTPLAVITGTASTLLDGVDEEARVELTQGIVTEAERLNRLVRNLLDMTRLDAGAITVHKEWQPIEEAIGVALDRTHAVLGARKVTTDVGADLAPYDSLLLQQVLINLLENAAKYTPPGSEILVRTEARPGEIEIAILDRGPGLAPGEETRVFEKFHRGERGASRGGGVGLGLTICKGIVTAHGGRIWAENRDGGGAAFHLTLPIEGEPPELAMPDEPNANEEVHP